MILSGFIRTVLVGPTKRMSSMPSGPSVLFCLPQNSMLKPSWPWPSKGSLNKEVPLVPDPVFNYQSTLKLSASPPIAIPIPPSSHIELVIIPTPSIFLCAFLPFHHCSEKFCSNTSSEVNSIIPFIQQFI